MGAPLRHSDAASFAAEESHRFSKQSFLTRQWRPPANCGRAAGTVRNDVQKNHGGGKGASQSLPPPWKGYAQKLPPPLEGVRAKAAPSVEGVRAEAAPPLEGGGGVGKGYGCRADRVRHVERSRDMTRFIQSPLDYARGDVLGRGGATYKSGRGGATYRSGRGLGDAEIEGWAREYGCRALPHAEAPQEPSVSLRERFAHFAYGSVRNEGRVGRLRLRSE